MDQQELTDEQKGALDEAKKRGAAFQEMKHSQGYAYLKAYVTTRVQAFATDALAVGFKDMSEYERRRGEVNGLRQLLADIEQAVKLLEDDKPTSKQTEA